MPDPTHELRELADRLRAAGVDVVHSFAWRDLDDAEAGGSELHADRILRRWAAAGVHVEHRTSAGDRPGTFERHGYRVRQSGGRYDVFARVAVPETLRRLVGRGRRDVAVVEIWNGVPWWSPVWHRGPRVTWLHHVHDRMWFDVLPRPLAHVGRTIERRVAPWAYRRGLVVTLSDSSAEEVRSLGLRHVVVVPPGVDERFRPAIGARSAHPSVVVVGRLAPVKRIEQALEAVRTARRRVPDLTVEVIGDGPERERLEGWIREHDAGSWATLAGRVDDDALVAAYQRAWVVMSASYAEGWGMSLTEAAACATPSVATDIAGHRGAVVPGATGELVPVHRLGDALATLVTTPDRLERYRRGAVAHAATLSWDAVAARQLECLVGRAEAALTSTGGPGRSGGRVRRWRRSAR